VVAPRLGLHEHACCQAGCSQQLSSSRCACVPPWPFAPGPRCFSGSSLAQRAASSRALVGWRPGAPIQRSVQGLSTGARVHKPLRAMNLPWRAQGQRSSPLLRSTTPSRAALRPGHGGTPCPSAPRPPRRFPEKPCQLVGHPPVRRGDDPQRVTSDAAAVRARRAHQAPPFVGLPRAAAAPRGRER
jgi:hypothetical protein